MLGSSENVLLNRFSSNFWGLGTDNKLLVSEMKKETGGRFHLQKKFGKFLLGISVWEKCVPFVTSPIRSQAPLSRFSESPANIQNGGQ